MSDFKKDFYSQAEAAELLQVHRNTISNLIKAGKLSYYQVGKQKRIAASELERLKVERSNSDNS